MKQDRLSNFGKYRWFLLVILSLLLLTGFVLFKRVDIAGLLSRPQPMANYADAVQRIEALKARQPAGIHPVCGMNFMTHGQKTERAIVFAHGYLSCPEQFRQLGQKFFDLGYNVLIVPLPHHGLNGRMTEEHAKLTAEEMVRYADDVADIAKGLGERVVMAGISGGGVVAAWAAQNRSDLDLAVIISPAFGYNAVPTALTGPATNLFTTLPNIWRNASSGSNNDLPYGYGRYSMRALAQFSRLGFAVQVRAQQAAPAVQSILVVTNANDKSVNNELTAKVVKLWRARGAKVTTYEFGADLQLGHDLIDPNHSYQQVDKVYPRLIEMITKS